MTTTETEKNLILNFNLVTVVCCDCYVDYWKNLRKLEDCVKEIDFSMEMKTRMRKYYSVEKKLFHCCVDCLKKVVFNHRDEFSTMSVGEYF